MGSPYHRKICELRNRYRVNSVDDDGVREIVFGIGRDEWFEIAELCIAENFADTGLSYQALGHVMEYTVSDVICKLRDTTLSIIHRDKCAEDLHGQLVRQVLSKCEFSPDDIPPVFVVRELLCLWIRFRNLASGRLPDGVSARDIARPVSNAAAQLARPEDAALVDRGSCLEIAEKLCLD